MGTVLRYDLQEALLDTKLPKFEEVFAMHKGYERCSICGLFIEQDKTKLAATTQLGQFRIRSKGD
jgi:hypothetical protein